MNDKLAEILLAENKITEEQARRLRASPSDWDYIPGGKGENAFVLACSGISPNMGLYGQDLYLARNLTDEQNAEFTKWRHKGLSIQESLKRIGITPFVGG